MTLLFPLPLNREPKEFKGLVIDAGVMAPLSLELYVEDMVPVREEETEEPFMERRASARSKTLPLNMEL